MTDLTTTNVGEIGNTFSEMDDTFKAVEECSKGMSNVTAYVGGVATGFGVAMLGKFAYKNVVKPLFKGFKNKFKSSKKDVSETEEVEETEK